MIRVFRSELVRARRTWPMFTQSRRGVFFGGKLLALLAFTTALAVSAATVAVGAALG